MDRILVQGLAIDTIIGVHDWEKTSKQQVILDIDVGVDTARAARSDRLQDTVSYGDIARAVTALVEQRQLELIEALAEEVAEMLLVTFAIEEVRLRLKKPAAVANAEFVAVEIERRKS